MVFPKVKRAMDHLDARRRRACDAISGRGRQAWNTDDVNAVRVVLDELRRLQRRAEEEG